MKETVMFDIPKAIKNSHLSKREVLHLQAEIKKEFPDDQMLYELHMIRALSLRAGKSKGLSKAKRFSLTGVLFFILITSNCIAATMGAPSQEALLKVFQDALNAKNEEAIMNLFYWEGVNEKNKSFDRKVVKSLFESDAKSIAFEEGIRTSDWDYAQAKDARVRPNLPILGFIKIQFSQKDSFALSLPYGKKENSFYFVGMIEEKKKNGVKDKFINVGILGASPNTNNLFAGYCICLEDGQETKIELNGDGNKSISFWGEYIKYCEFHKISGDSPIGLRISEDEREIFKSDVVSNGAITYKAPNH